MISVQSRCLAALVAVVLGACAGSGALGRGKGRTAQELYDGAMKDLKDAMYAEALSGFADVKAKYPYSKYTALADLRTADTHYEQGKYVEAVDAYRQFIKLHPTHEEVPYSMLRIGEAFVKQAPEDMWFMPPSSEKDQANIRLAISAYQDLIDRFPKSDVAGKAREELQLCRRRLAKHELYVADFYFKRDKWRAAANRAEGLVRDYPGVGFDTEALWMAARARRQAGDAAEARADAEKLVEKFPASSEAKDAKALLKELPAAGAAAQSAPPKGG